MSRLKMLPKSLISSRPEQRLHPRNGRYQRLERHRPSQLEFPRRNIALARFADDEAGAPARSPLIEIRHSAGKRGWLKTSFLGHLSDHKRQEYQNFLFSETK
jgi:hypothetical protein